MLNLTYLLLVLIFAYFGSVSGKKFFLSICFILLAATGSQNRAIGWGFFAHKLINRMAVLSLPDGLIGFYKKHIEFVTDHAVDPDQRRNVVPEEAARHYIDIDHYGKDAFRVVPRPWFEAVKKYSEDTLQAYGIVPWWIEVMKNRLTSAFKKGDVDRILRYSADIGHYIGDAHVPLHTTENYNGQLTNQKGIHGFWESRLPELMSKDYDYWTGKTEYLESPLDFAWNTVEGSHRATDSVLHFEAALNKLFDSDKKYALESKSGGATMRVYSEAYSREYDRMLNGMTERRLRRAIRMVSSMWMTCWIDAGQPDMRRMESGEVSDSLKQAAAAEEYLWKTGKRLERIKGHED
jgi:hypothetical protein